MKERKPWWFHSNYTIINDWWFCHRSTGKTVRKQLIKAIDFLSKCIFSNWSVNKNVFCYFFPPPESSTIMQRKPGLIFQTLFSFCFSCSVPSYLIPPYIHCCMEWVSGVWALKQLCLSVYLLLRINHWQKGKQMEWVCTLLPGWALPIGNPITKQTWLSSNGSEQNQQLDSATSVGCFNIAGFACDSVACTFSSQRSQIDLKGLQRDHCLAKYLESYYKDFNCFFKCCTFTNASIYSSVYLYRLYKSLTIRPNPKIGSF